MSRLVLVCGFATAVALVAFPDAPYACTVIAVGKKATTDGSVITTHTVDSHRTGSAVKMVPRKKHKKDKALPLTKRKENNTPPMNRWDREPTGEIPQVGETFKYLAPAYPPMNEFQVAIGESTFGGREELRSEKGAIDCETLQTLMMERAKTAEEAIRIGGALIDEHGWTDEGESLAIADKNELWIMEIVGPGKEQTGAIWAAKRIPADHFTVIANSSRIGELDLSAKGVLASKNVVSAAIEKGYFRPDSGEPFRFNYAYNPSGPPGRASQRRIWRVMDLLCPSAEFDPNGENLPFSLRPESKISLEKVMELLRDTYEGTDYDPVKHLTVVDEETGKAVRSPVANPFMSYDMNKMLRTNGGWSWRGERPIARWYTMYVTITQSRDWLPDPIGGVVWFGYDNTAMTTYVPVYMGIKDLPKTFKTDGRATGFSRKSAWWAFNRVATISGHRWEEMRKNVAVVRDKLQKQIFENQKEVEETAVRLHKMSPNKASVYLTKYLVKASTSVVNSYWDLGDFLWSAYDEMW